MRLAYTKRSEANVHTPNAFGRSPEARRRRNLQCDMWCNPWRMGQLAAQFAVAQPTAAPISKFPVSLLRGCFGGSAN
eukprot:2043375-Pyramimonas_sp.AAC.1